MNRVPSSRSNTYEPSIVPQVVRSGTAFEGELRLRDGRIIDYQIQVLPDGGRLLTYFDITELKRSEETAREARDAAEIALDELRAAQDRLVQTQKLASLGQLTAGTRTRSKTHSISSIISRSLGQFDR